MVEFDKAAVPATEIAVKLRHGATNAKLPRTAFNIQAAIMSLLSEGLALEGDTFTYELTDKLGEAFAHEYFGESVAGDEHANHVLATCIGALVQALVNNPNGQAEEIAGLIFDELLDMELLGRGRIRQALDRLEK